MQVLFVYDKAASPTVSVALKTRGHAAYKYSYDGSSAIYRSFDCITLRDVSLAPGTAAIFRLNP